jgi:hypothetical protein
MTEDLFRPAGLEAAIAAVKDEIGYRRSVYPRLVRERRMTQERADQRIRQMREVLALLEAQALTARVVDTARDVVAQRGAAPEQELAEAIAALDRFMRTIESLLRKAKQ